jgi:hypothetical protein
MDALNQIHLLLLLLRLLHPLARPCSGCSDGNHGTTRKHANAHSGTASCIHPPGGTM